MENADYEEVAGQLKNRVHAYASHLLRDREEALDVAQEALVKLWQHCARVDREGARPWLMRTTHNLCIDRVRKRKVRAEVEGETLMPLLADGAPGPARLTASSELGRVIEESLGQLPTRDRAVLLMREVQGMAYDEIARVLDLPLGTLKARLHRARERLRAQLVRAGVTP